MARKNSVKERILEVTSRLFYKQGFNSTGINQIINEAGIAIGSLYKHFPSKNDLLYCYLQKQEEEYFRNLDSYFTNETLPLPKLLKLIDYRIEMQQKADYSGCHFVKINAETGRQDKRINKLVLEHKRKQRSFINEIITEISGAENLLMEKNTLANTIYLMIEGAVVCASINGNTDDLKTVKKSVINLF